MQQSLFLGREVLDGDAEGLRRILAGHTGCERTATELLITLDRARRDAEVRYCWVWRRAADEGPGWRVHFTYEPAALAPEPAELEQESCMA
ncbi:MAG TPA: hypothetical protein VHG91_10250 [Longimicrobium sp.]|nr:hypothetical protein [Longimicrobium sp.]